MGRTSEFGEIYCLGNQRNQLVFCGREAKKRGFGLYRWKNGMKGERLLSGERTFDGAGNWCSEPFACPREDSQREFFLLEYADGESHVVGQRILPAEGLINLRDLGGYPARDGRRVKWGLLYRSDQFGNLNDGGLAYVRNLGIRTVVDYRSEEESKKYPNRDIGAFATYNLNPSAQTAELSAQFQAKKEEEDRELVAASMAEAKKGPAEGDRKMIGQYRSFASGEVCRQAFKKMFHLAADGANAPLVQHCRGGKDRTGFGSLLLLLALGVDEETAVRDYMITEHVRTGRNRTKMEKYRHLTDDPVLLDYLYALIATRESFIRASVDEMRRMCGDTDTYIRQVMEVTGEELGRMRDFYLE